MPAPGTLADHYQQDYADYRAMYQVGLEQRDCIAREDLEGLSVSIQRLRRLMDRINLRQAGRPAAGSPSPEEERQREELRRLLGELQELRRDNEAAVQQLLARTREEMRQYQQRRRAIRGYRVNAPEEARFFDGVR